MDCLLPVSSIHGILQARILEVVAVSSSSLSSQHRIWIFVSCIGWQVLCRLNHQGSMRFWLLKLLKMMLVQFSFRCWLHYRVITQHRDSSLHRGRSCPDNSRSAWEQENRSPCPLTLLLLRDPFLPSLPRDHPFSPLSPVGALGQWINVFYWHIVALQCCVSFHCTKWISYIYVHICPPFWISFPFRSPSGSPRLKQIVPQSLVVHLYPVV